MVTVITTTPTRKNLISLISFGVMYCWINEGCAVDLASLLLMLWVCMSSLTWDGITAKTFRVVIFLLFWECVATTLVQVNLLSINSLEHNQFCLLYSSPAIKMGNPWWWRKEVIICVQPWSPKSLSRTRAMKKIFLQQFYAKPLLNR